MDLVLFVRHGEFYNLFDVDADMGMRVGLNLSGAKGGCKAANMWKVCGLCTGLLIYAGAVNLRIGNQPPLACVLCLGTATAY